ncbi:hypothetical protein B0T12DRAFT_362816 [Alternaria alternata]|nr:hypothetical protein B0T12DRAFT_362816 [Alternaria alternata]
MSSPAQPSPQVLQAYHQRLETLYSSLPDLLTTEQEDKTGTEALEQDVGKLDVKEQNLEDRVNKYCQEFLYIGGAAGSTFTDPSSSFPLILSPAETTLTKSSSHTGLTDKIAKESSDSTASSHANHADIQAHNSKGPAIPNSMPKAESKEDLKKRAEELNK